MSIEENRGRTRFADGMRVAREHLDHLQGLSLEGDRRLREAIGPGRVAHGLRVLPMGGARVRVEPGFAIDGKLRPLALDAAIELDLPETGSRRLVLAHRLRGEWPYRGTPTVFHDEVALELREGTPPYADGAVAFAMVAAGPEQASVTPIAGAYLPGPGHRHTGEFHLGEDQRWRYDGSPLTAQGLAEAVYDSGPVRMDSGQSRDLDHGLGTRDFIISLEAHVEGMATNRGLGSEYWYEIHGEDSVRLVRAAEGSTFAGELKLRLRLWGAGGSNGGGAGQARRPLADAGPDQEVDGLKPFTLDGGESRAFDGRSLSRYRWTRMS